MSGVHKWVYRTAFAVIFIAVLIIAADIVVLIFSDRSDAQYMRGPTPSDAAPEITVLPSEAVSMPNFVTDPETSRVTTAVTTGTASTETSRSAETTDEKPIEPEHTEPPIVPEEPLPPHSYAGQLPERETVTDDYFANAVFIGDSRTVGFCNFTGISPYCYARVSLNIKSVLTSRFIEDSSVNPPAVRTVLETVGEYPNSFGKIYISFGVNEYSMPGNLFITCYEHFIGELIALLPEGTPIYVQSVLPINEKQAIANGYNVKNSQLIGFNDLLVEMCGNYDGVYFVNTAEAVIENDLFVLPDRVSNDGIHMNKSTCDKVKDYLYTHTAD